MTNIKAGVALTSQSSIEPKLQYTNAIRSKILKSGNRCFYPVGQWAKRQFTTHHENELDSIYIFSLQNDCSAEFKKTFLKRVNSLHPKEIYELGNWILSNIDKLEIDKLRSCEIKLHPPYKNSTAYNLNTGEYMGLHIDTHDGILNRKREKAWQLISINLGRAERFLHYVDLTYNQIVKLLRIERKREIQENKFSMFKVVELFFEKYPNYPVNRIVLPPNHGYVARTQNFIHDGGTNWKGQIDISLLISGYFNILKSPH